MFNSWLFIDVLPYWKAFCTFSLSKLLLANEAKENLLNTSRNGSDSYWFVISTVIYGMKLKLLCKFCSDKVTFKSSEKLFSFIIVYWKFHVTLSKYHRCSQVPASVWLLSKLLEMTNCPWTRYWLWPVAYLELCCKRCNSPLTSISLQRSRTPGRVTLRRHIEDMWYE